jgi:hypothetical protein
MRLCELTTPTTKSSASVRGSITEETHAVFSFFLKKKMVTRETLSYLYLLWHPVFLVLLLTVVLPQSLLLH